MLKLNIGCGKKHLEGYLNIDKLAEVKPDEVVEILNGLPYDNGAFEEVNADYVLCQIANRDNFKFVMNEIWRVLKIDGLFKLKVPNAKYSDSFNDPMDCRYFTEETFDYFDETHYRYKAFEYGFRPWKIVSIEPERETRLQVIMKK